MVKIKKAVTKEDRILYILDILCVLQSDLRSLSIGERELILLVSGLPIELRYSPFSLAPRKIYAEKLNKSLTDVNRLIEQINKKGYLVEKWGEYFLLPAINNLMIQSSTVEELVIHIQLSSPVEEPIPKTKEDVNEGL